MDRQQWLIEDINEPTQSSLTSNYVHMVERSKAAVCKTAWGNPRARSNRAMHSIYDSRYFMPGKPGACLQNKRISGAIPP